MTTQEQPVADSRSPARFWIHLALGVGFTFVTAILYGHYSLRWGPTPDLQAAGKHLQTMPKLLGDWQLLEERPMGENAIKALNCAGYVNRQYVNRQTGDTIGVALMTGPGGPMSVHTAEVCYSSRAYEIPEPRQKVRLAGLNSTSHAFWKVTFRSRNSLITDRLRVYYGWSTGDTWLASDRARYDFAPYPILFKLQLAGSLPLEETPDAEDPCRSFLEELLKSDWTVVPD